MCWPVFYTLRVEKQNCRADTANVLASKCVGERIQPLGPEMGWVWRGTAESKKTKHVGNDA